MEVPYMPWISDHAGSTNGSRKRRQRCCLPPLVQRGHPDRLISRLNSPACTCPCERFATPSRDIDASLGAAVGRYPFGVELFHLLLHAGLSRRFHKIEHRLFSQITLNWRGRPLTSHQIIVDLIGATNTATGLTVRAELDTGTYPTGIRYTKAQVDALPLTRHEFHGEWNYTVTAPPSDTPTST